MQNNTTKTISKSSAGGDFRTFALILFLGLAQLASGQTTQPSNTPKDTSTSFTRFRLGSYGEMLYQYMNYGPDRYSDAAGAPADSRSKVSIPRMVLGLDYWFTRDIQFSTEIEFEHGGTGNAMELEYEEMGEYEMETEHGGEVALEQFHLTKQFSEAFKIRAGHFIVPIGQTNSRHLPLQFFGTIRPESESELLPLTWHETGIEIFGKYKTWAYELQLVSGLDANGFSSANWIKGGYQGKFEGLNITSPAVVARIDKQILGNLRISASGYYNHNTGKNTTEPKKMQSVKGSVAIVAADAEFNNKKLIVRANAVYGSLSDSYRISLINRNLSSNSQFVRSPVASNALSYGIEAGFNILSLTGSAKKLFPFARYEFYNSMYKTESNMLADARFNRRVVTVGLNYFLLPNLVLKADYAMRSIDNGNYNNENTFGLAVAYSAWFVQK